MANTVLSGAYVWRTKNAVCSDARVERLNSAPVFSNRSVNSLGYLALGEARPGPIFSPPPVVDSVSVPPVPMTPDLTATFIAESVADIPDAKQKNDAEKRMRAAIIVDPSKDDTAIIEKGWTDCEAETRTKAHDEFDKEHAAFLRDFVCDMHDNRKAIAKGIVRNWISQDADRRNFSAQLAGGLLGEDGKVCAATRDLDEPTKELLRAAVDELRNAVMRRPANVRLP